MPELDPELMRLFRDETSERLERIERTLLELEAGHAAADAIDVLFRDAHSIKGNAAMIGFDEASHVAHAMEDVLEPARAAGAFPAELTGPLLHATDAVRRAVSGDAAGVDEAIAALAEEEENGDSAPAATVAEPEHRSMRVDAGKVDGLLDAVGETVLQHRRLEHALDAADETLVAEELDRGGRMLGELQEAVIGMRTLPLQTITAPFPRAVRDMAERHGKHCELRMLGTETQLDRVILDGLGEMIVHLLRNAVSHGIEPPEQRIAAGKDPEAVIELRAEQRAGRVLITVADDGGGVPEEVLARARQVGSLAEVMTLPGFSTAEEVSDLSGRGVGLDAVKAHVEALSGSIEVTSTPGEGTAVAMNLPMTLALLRLLLVERSGLPFGIPVANIVELVRVDEVTSLRGARALMVRGEPVPIVDLSGLFGEPDAPPPRGAPAAVIAAAGRRVAVTGNELLGEQEVVVKALGTLLRGLRGYLGATVLGDGRVALIVDPAFFVRWMANPLPPAGAAPVGDTRPETGPPPCVLVVDDQFTVRELQRSILEGAGYRVVTAADGREALDVLATRDDIDLVVTDLEIPRVDGFELIARLRAHDVLRELPVIVVTSRGSDEDRRRGAEAGADAYIVKDEFDQRALLETVGRLART